MVYCAGKLKGKTNDSVLLIKLFYKSNRPHFLWVFPLGMLGEHEKFGS